MRRNLIFILLMLFIAFPLSVFLPSLRAQTEKMVYQQLNGDWGGALEVGGIRLRLVFHFQCQPGSCTGKLDSVDQGAFGIPMGRIKIKGQTIEVLVPSVMGRFKGTLSPDGMILKGRWMQAGQSLPLDLRKGLKIKGPKRPQEPKPPFPYVVEDVRFPGGADGVTLAGTLTHPKSEGPFPAVVLISGSGPQNRDEFIMGHKPFLLIADTLTREGWAVLRYDDRGVGDSTGQFTNATLDDFVADTVAAIRYLQTRPDINSRVMGLIGHSEGAAVAIRAAVAEQAPVSFIVMLSGPTVRGSDVLLLQDERLLKAAGVDEETARSYRDLIAGIIELVLDKNLTPDARAKAIGEKLRAYAEKLPEPQRKAMGLDEAGIRRQMNIVQMPWFRRFLTEDPRQLLVKLTIPLLAIYGEKDLQVPPDQNIPPLIQALEKAGLADYAVLKFKGLNHLLQPARTGLPAEYGQIETTIAPEVLEALRVWLRRFLQRPGSS